VPLGLDGDFTYESLIGRHNADLANDLGNLLHRTLTMAGKFCAGRVPPAHERFVDVEPHAGLCRMAHATAVEAAAGFEALAPSRALEAIWKLIRETNRYVDGAQPWVMAKDATRGDELAHTVHTFLAAIDWAARMIAPAMPERSAEIRRRLGVAPAAIPPWPEPATFYRSLAPGLVLERGEPLFPRIDEERAAELYRRWIPADVRPAPATSAPPPGKT
jgi:methionyl-tRNA synthetase